MVFASTSTYLIYACILYIYATDRVFAFDDNFAMCDKLIFYNARYESLDYNRKQVDVGKQFEFNVFENVALAF